MIEILDARNRGEKCDLRGVRCPSGEADVTLQRPEARV